MQGSAADFVSALLLHPCDEGFVFTDQGAQSFARSTFPRPWRGYPLVPPHVTLRREIHNWFRSGVFPLKFVQTEHLPFCESGNEDHNFDASALLDDVRLAVKDDDYRNLLIKLGLAGIARLLGLRATAGSVHGVVPPRRQTLVDAAAVRVSSKAGARLNVAARALAKHCGRLPVGWGTSWWGAEKDVMTGGDVQRNKLAGAIVNTILDNAVWMNIHHAPGGVIVLELRVEKGYGQRFNANAANEDTAGGSGPTWTFRGFLEPHSNEMADIKKARK